MEYKLIATATFGLEAVVRREVEALGYEIIKTEDGKVTFAGDERAIVRSNLWLRTADRVLLKIAEFEAREFEELFQGTKAYPWEELIPADGKFTVTGTSVKSKLHSVPACQSIVKKAIVERMKPTYGLDKFEETGAEYTVKTAILKDRVTLTVDTTGQGLHKEGVQSCRGGCTYKGNSGGCSHSAELLERRPCAGGSLLRQRNHSHRSGTHRKNIAPGLNRSFACEDWQFIDRNIWKEERQAAFEAINTEPAPVGIFARDISSRAIAAAEENAGEAGVADFIDFRRADIKALRQLGGAEDGIICTNLPYGMRIGSDDEISGIYIALRRFMKQNPHWSAFVITADKEMEKAMGRHADRRRKLYNGNIETTYYQFHGKKRRR